LFTGHSRDDVTSNDDRRYRYRTVFEVARNRPRAAPTSVAAFVSWTTQARLTATAGGRFVSNGPFEPVPPELEGEAAALASRLERWLPHEDESMRYDAFTHELAMEWLRRYRPMLLHVGFGETDVDAHARRYDRYIEMLHTTDRMLSDLWHAAQADPLMAGRVAMVVTTDHGRGPTSADWTNHGEAVDNASRWWFLAAGAGVARRGSVDLPMTQSQVAPTILMLLGLDPAALDVPVDPPARAVVAP
jgi:hypothetical protein